MEELDEEEPPRAPRDDDEESEEEGGEEGEGPQFMPFSEAKECFFFPYQDGETLEELWVVPPPRTPPRAAVGRRSLHILIR